MGLFSRAKSTGVVKRIGTQFTFPDPCNANSQPFCNLALAPADISKIYNVPNLTLSPAPGTLFNGDGTTIGIVDESNIDINDVTAFRALYGLPAANVNVILSGPDPGLVPGAELESDLDVQLAGAVAPDATIDLIVAESTEVSLGADLAAQYAVDNNIAPILNESFGLCEFFIGTTGNTFYNNLWQQAAALGITVTVSSGDGGAAGCEQGSGAATLGLAVSGFTSTPYNVSVGGTDFNDLNNAASFWNLSSGDTPTVASAKSYIPEIAWDSTCTNAEIFSFFGTTTAEQTCNKIIQPCSRTA
jgi:subtilase family serine protease